VVAAAVAAVALLGCGWRPPPAPPSETWPGPAVTAACTVRVLPLPEGVPDSDSIEVLDMDPTGRYVVGAVLSRSPPYQQRPVLWDNGVARLPEVPGTDGRLTAVNSHGWAVGESDEASAYLLVPGESDPVVLPDASVPPIDINEAGQIVGASYPDVEQVWTPGPDGEFSVRSLDHPLGRHMLGITDDGTVIGWISYGSNPDAPYAWDADGTARKLTPPEGISFQAFLDLNGDWALIETRAEENSFGLARWNVRTGESSIMDWFNKSVSIWLGNPVVSPAGIAFSGEPGYLVVNDEAFALAVPASQPDDRWGAAPAAVSADDTVVAGTMVDLTGEERPSKPVLWRC
jgi:hypothetical protein